MYSMTIWYDPAHPEWYDRGIADYMKLVREVGFTHAHWNPDAGSSYMYSQSEIDHIKEHFDRSGLKACSMHAAHGIHRVMEIESETRDRRKDFTSGVEWRRQAGMELIVNRLQLADRIGAKNMVLHVTLPKGFEEADIRREFLANVFRSFDEIRPTAEKLGVSIAVENLMNTPKEIGILFESLFERYPLEFVGWCYDAGHAQISGEGDHSFLRPFTERMIITHLHDNHATSDEHLLPGDGNINWEACCALIADSPAELPLNFETPWLSYEMGQSEFLQKALASMIALTESVTVRRKIHQDRI